MSTENERNLKFVDLSSKQSMKLSNIIEAQKEFLKKNKENELKKKRVAHREKFKTQKEAASPQ